MKRKALFLDRDGVINTDYGYVHKIQNFEFIEGIFELSQQAVLNGYLILVITNQAGIGRGFYTTREFKDLSDWMCQQFLENGSVITKVYYSPFHPTCGVGVYKKDHETRKPKPGMIQLAADEFDLDLSSSILIGDKKTDIQAGNSAGVGVNILYSDTKNSNKQFSNKFRFENELQFYEVNSLLEAISLL
jgi:D-glycero-D-manno-heptose 1,7-bisphosphate phosphatase